MVILIITFFLLFSGCTESQEAGNNPDNLVKNVSDAPMLMSVSSVLNGSTLPEIYSCNGPGQIPAIFWTNPPPNAKSMVLIMDDPDASDGVFTHWIVYNLTPESGGIPSNQLPISEYAGTGLQGINSMNTRGYAPPCPPGTELHRYVFTLYALDAFIFPEIKDRFHIDAAMQGHVIIKKQIVTVFSQK